MADLKSRKFVQNKNNGFPIKSLHHKCKKMARRISLYEQHI